MASKKGIVCNCEHLIRSLARYLLIITHIWALETYVGSLSDLVITGNFGVILYEAINASIELSNGVEEAHHKSIHRLSVSWHSIMFTASK